MHNIQYELSSASHSGEGWTKMLKHPLRPQFVSTLKMNKIKLFFRKKYLMECNVWFIINMSENKQIYVPPGFTLFTFSSSKVQYQKPPKLQQNSPQNYNKTLSKYTAVLKCVLSACFPHTLLFHAFISLGTTKLFLFYSNYRAAWCCLHSCEGFFSSRCSSSLPLSKDQDIPTLFPIVVQCCAKALGACKDIMLSKDGI